MASALAPEGLAAQQMPNLNAPAFSAMLCGGLYDFALVRVRVFCVAFAHLNGSVCVEEVGYGGGEDIQFCFLALSLWNGCTDCFS